MDAKQSRFSNLYRTGAGILQNIQNYSGQEDDITEAKTDRRRMRLRQDCTFWSKKSPKCTVLIGLNKKSVHAGQ